MYEVEDGLPIPFKAKTKYPFHNMEVGQHFTVPHNGNKTKVARRVGSAIAQQHRHYPGVRYVQRSYDDCIRVWRES